MLVNAGNGFSLKNEDNKLSVCKNRQDMSPGKSEGNVYYINTLKRQVFVEFSKRK